MNPLYFRFAGVVMGICNTSGQLAGVFAPIAIGALTTDVSNFTYRSGVCFGIEIQVSLLGCNYTVCSQYTYINIKKYECIGSVCSGAGHDDCH